MDKNKILSVLAAIGLCLFMVFGLAWCNRDPGHHKYQVKYTFGKYQNYDYTDSITHENGCVKYIDEDNHEVEQCGTVQVNRQY